MGGAQYPAAGEWVDEKTFDRRQYRTAGPGHRDIRPVAGNSKGAERNGNKGEGVTVRMALDKTGKKDC
jgi:hypothetical protein